MQASYPILIAGVGNWLLSDDGLGVHAVHQLRQQPIAGVLAVDFGTAILHGLAYLEASERVLLIDAVKGGQPPGTIYRFQAALDWTPEGPVSIHALGWREALRFLPPGRRPPTITVLGVEPASLAYGLELSAVVQAALPTVVALARDTVAGWRAERSPSPTLASYPEPFLL